MCTIDAFCMQLLKRYCAELGLPPDVELADDAKAYTLRQNALSAVLEELYEDADFCAFASPVSYTHLFWRAPVCWTCLRVRASLASRRSAAALRAVCLSTAAGRPVRWCGKT